MKFNYGNARKTKKRRTLALFALFVAVFGLSANATAQSGRRSANNANSNLHISVVVMPVLQAAALRSPVYPNQAISFQLQAPPQEQKFEMRVLPPNTTTDPKQQAPMVLKTLVVVPQ